MSGPARLYHYDAWMIYLMVVLCPAIINWVCRQETYLLQQFGVFHIYKVTCHEIVQLLLVFFTCKIIQQIISSQPAKHGSCFATSFFFVSQRDVLIMKLPFEQISIDRSIDWTIDEVRVNALGHDDVSSCWTWMQLLVLESGPRGVAHW